jgi:DNA damage-binding protein 2
MVKIWDIRSISSKDSALAVLPHDKPVNSAHFSLVSGDKLLTTDHHSQLRVYQAPSFNTYKTIPHPHRQFQHLTPIKATWYPLTDIVVVGRYPDPKFPSYLEGERRTIDFFSGVAGESLLQLHQPGLDKIISLSQFNTSGDLMLSSLAGSLLLWKAKPDTSDWEEDTSSQVLEDSWPDFTSKVKRKVQK